MGRNRCSRVIVLTVFAALFVFAFACTAFAEGTDPVIYDAAEFSNLNGRTQSDVMEKYTQAQAEGTTYLNSSSASYYDVPASLRAPYAAGVISSDTLKAMKGMTNFYRWLIGVGNLSVNTESNASLQAQALDRNFNFAHYISNSDKPADMDDDLWQQGFACDHNILAGGYTPSGAITGWLNEGYRKSDGTWDAIGHRTAILTAGYQSISYGYSGRVAIGKCGASGNTFTNAFASFPAAGYMPAELVSKSEASWTVQLNTSIVKASNTSNVVITVKNLATGQSYSCQKSDNTAQIDNGFLNFMQPQDATGSNYTDSYQVTATGLTDVATGNPAEIRYTVNFFSLPTIKSVSLSQQQFAYTGNQIRPEVTVKGSQGNLTNGQDYTVTYHNNIEAGTGIVEVNGTGNYCGTLKKTFSIEVDRKNMDQCVISISPTSSRYTGNAITPTVTVTSFGNALTEGRDFKVTYRNNINAGTATAVISGIGEYSGSVEKTFTITKGWQSIKQSVSAYEIEVGGTAKITASAKENADITFTSSDESIATVDADGTVHAVEAGEVKITITALETTNYGAGSVSVWLTTSRDIHSMEDTDVVYADNENETAEVTRVCSVCGKKETTSFTTMRSFWVYYWTGNSGSSNISASQMEGDQHRITIGGCTPSDAENKMFVLESSDTSIMTVNGSYFQFVGAGTVTLTIYAKYRPTTKITKTFTVSHVWDEGVVTRPSTCSVKGEKLVTCTKCGATETTEIKLDPDKHTGETVFTDEKEATCNEEGFTGNTRCAGCNEILEEGKVIPINSDAHDWAQPSYAWSDDHSNVTATRLCKHNRAHKETETVAASSEITSKASCTKEGEVKYTSGKFVNPVFAVQHKTEVIDKLPHPWDSGTVKVAATCSEAGQMLYECTACDATKTEPIKVDSNAHDWAKPSYIWSENHSTVTATRLCKHNKSHKETETVAASSEITKEASCTEEGEAIYTSDKFVNSAFAAQTKKEVLSKTEHPYSNWSITKEPTCKTEGTRVKECAICGDEVTEPIKIDPDAHQWDAGVVTTEPKCSNTGVRTYTCQLCGEERREAIDKLAHTPGEAKIEHEIPAACTEDGSYDEVVYCDVCGAEIDRETRSIPATGHNDSMEYTEAKAATCMENGNSEYWYCSKCETYFADENGETIIPENSWILPATGHKWDEGKITTAPTAMNKGVKTFTCLNCGETRTESLPARNNQVAPDGTKVGPGASDEVAKKAITGMKSDKDPKGSAFGLLKVKSAKQSKISVTVTWSKVKGAKTYVIYGNQCGKSNKMKKLKTVTGKSLTVKQVINNKGKKVKVKKGTYYKFIVVALDGNRNVVSTSKVIHAATKGGKVGNDKAVTTKAKKNKVTVKAGKSFALKAKAVPASKKLKVKKHRGIAYESSNQAIATVSAKGVITGKKKGTCYVYAYAQNGVCKKIKVTVK